MNASRAFKEVPQLPSKQAAEVFGDVHAVVEALSREVLFVFHVEGRGGGRVRGDDRRPPRSGRVVGASHGGGCMAVG